MKYIVAIFVLLFVFTSDIAAQEYFVDKIHIDSIQRIQINDNTLEVDVVISNNNNKTLRFVSGVFEFYFGSTINRKNCLIEGVYERCKEDRIWYRSCGNPDPKKKIGTDPDFNSEEICPGQKSLLEFQIQLEPTKSEAIEHILNCIGDPCCKKPYINIVGPFELGVESEKGWTTGRDLKIEWEFEPKTQEEKVLLE